MYGRRDGFGKYETARTDGQIKGVNKMSTKKPMFIYPTNQKVGEGEPNLNDVADFISKNNSNESVIAFLNKVRPINDDLIKGYLDSDNGKKLSASLFDARVQKAIQTHDAKFETEKLPEIKNQIRTELAKEYNVKETPEQKSIRELSEKQDKLIKDLEREKIRNKALEEINKQKLPFAELVDSFISDKLEDTINKIAQFKTIFDSAVEAKATELQGDNSGRKPQDREKETKKSLETKLDAAIKKGDLLEQLKIRNQLAGFITN
jgi:hypothetical protein